MAASSSSEEDDESSSSLSEAAFSDSPSEPELESSSSLSEEDVESELSSTFLTPLVLPLATGFATSASDSLSSLESLSLAAAFFSSSLSLSEADGLGEGAFLTGLLFLPLVLVAVSFATCLAFTTGVWKEGISERHDF